MKFIFRFIPVIFTLCFYYSFPQDTSTIKGRVTDSKDGSGITADVKLFKGADSNIVKGTVCDSSGTFTLEGIAFGTYRLEISAIDYNIFAISKLAVNSALVTLDTLHLKKQNITTGEILVEDEKGILMLKGDKKIFNVDKTILSKGGNALDVLRKTPLVDVDINDQISLRGSTNVKILVNDKPNKFVNLKTLPSDAIERVELITNPSAKYTAEGVTGIINIVLKKGEGIGFNGSIYTGIGSKDKYYGGLSLNFKKDKITLFASGQYGLYNYGYDFTSNTEYFTPPSFLDASGSGNGRSKYGNGSFVIEYDPAPKNTIGFETYFNRYKYTSINDNRYNNFDSLRYLTYFYTGYFTYTGDGNSYSLSTYYTGKYDDLGRELAVDLTYSGNTNNNASNSNISWFNSTGVQNGNSNIKIDVTDNKQYNFNAQTDYTHPFGQKIKLETGYKGTFRANDNNFSSDTLNYSNGQYETNLITANRFKLTENINAAYATFSNSIGNFGYKIGLRTEYTHSKGELVSTGEVFTKNYIDFFPTVNLNYTIGVMNQISASYSRRITRPNIWRLNPFVYRYSARSIFYGNPELKPEFTNSYELSFIYYSNIITLTPIAFYRRSTGIMSSYSYLQDSITTVTTYRNANGSDAYGVDLILNSRSLKWLNLNGTLSFYKTKFDEEAVTDYNAEEGFSWKANIRSYITIAGFFNIEMYYNYSGRKVNQQGINDPSSSFDFGISATLLKNKLSMSLRASDVFRTQNWSSNTNAAGYTAETRNTYDSRVFFLNISYSFGNTDEYYSKKKKTKQNQNEGQDQNENNQGR